MQDESNPYQAPSDAPFGAESRQTARWDGFAWTVWPIVFTLNTLLPLFLGWSITAEWGRIGVCLAGLVILLGGWALCYASPPLARRLIAGSTVTALAQFFPILHFILGALALRMVTLLGLMVPGGETSIGHIPSVSGGFVVTSLVGGGLVVCAMGFGMVLALVLPEHWYSPDVKPSSAELGASHRS